MPATKAQLQETAQEVVSQILSMLDQGQKEYAAEDNVLQNFEDIAKEVGISREQVFYTFFKKHLDGIKSHIRGFKTQRDSIDGRITDAMVYLVLFKTMVKEARGDFLEKSSGMSASSLSTENTKEAYSDGHPKPENSVGQSSGLNVKQSSNTMPVQESTLPSSQSTIQASNEPAMRYVSPLKDG